MTQPRENRCRALWVPQDDVLAMTRQFWSAWPEYLSFARLEPAPGGARLLDVCWSWDRRSFGFRLGHDSFAPVPEGEVTPDLGAGRLLHYERVRLCPAGSEGLHAAALRVARAWEGLDDLHDSVRGLRRALGLPGGEDAG